MGRVARNSVYDINVYQGTAPTIVLATADPESGPAPLSVSLDGLIQSQHQIICYLWDFQGDGNIDYLSLDSPAVDHIYGETGGYDAELSVIDDEGLLTSDTVYIQVSAGRSEEHTSELQSH